MNASVHLRIPISTMRRASMISLGIILSPVSFLRLLLLLLFDVLEREALQDCALYRCTRFFRVLAYREISFHRRERGSREG